VTAELTPAVEALIERYARRARRVVSPPNEAIQPVKLEYVTTGSSGRLSVLRRLLDDLDPERALVYVRTDESRIEAAELLRSLGYAGDRAAVTLGKSAEPGTPLVLLLDLPASREELREVTGAESPRVIAVVQPRQITSLRALAAGGPVQPVTLPQAALRARGRDAIVRDELAEVLARGDFGRELLALEPLLDRYDGIEIAAASLRLLEGARHALETAETASATAGGARGAGDGLRPSMDVARLFITIGERDGARPGDLVGAITAVAGITSAQIGRIEMRDTHSLVEVAANVADAVAEKLTGTTIRGRRAVARLDQERPRAPRARGDRPERPRGERPDRPRGERPERSRGERPERGRGERPDRGRGERPPRSTNRRDRE
jgi:ATP-dependent RNA helicase DeaD